MKKYIVVLLFGVCLQMVFAGEYSVYEANYPQVRDYNVKIDEATLVIHPRGNFVEMNIYMTVSYDFESWFFKNYDELEFQWKFSLPENAIMHDFWIWYGDSIMTATVLDKWTAELLFSDVSTPVRNPGLLTQSKSNLNGMVDYELELFPLMRNEKKRFKIQYLLPARPSIDELRVWLPTTQLFSMQSNMTDSLKIIYKYDNTESKPDFIGTEILYQEHLPKNSAWLSIIPLEADQFVEFGLPSPIKEDQDFYFSTFEYGGENYYHLAVYPPESPLIQDPRNLLVIIDFNRFNTDGFDGEFLLFSLKEIIQQTMTEKDSLNLLVAYDDVILASEEWMSCSEVNIDFLFSKAMKSSFPSFNNFQPLMTKAAEFINKYNSSSQVMLFSNLKAQSLQVSDKEQFAEDVKSFFKPGTVFHMIDLDNMSYLTYSYNTNFRYYYYFPQLESFYGTLTYSSGGNLYFLHYYSLKTILSALFYEKISHFESVEVQLSFANGYAHSQHLMTLNEGYYPLHYPIMQVGKYNGSFPIDVTVLGKLKMDKLSKKFTITEADTSVGSAQIVTSWYGDQIRDLLSYSYNPITVNDIINLSKEQKILTPYSGFLIYHPDENHGFCKNCRDETQLTDIEQEDAAIDSLVELSAYPNPFNSDVTISFKLPSQDNVTLHIFDILGREVWQEDISAQSGSVQQISWHGKNMNGQSVSTGIYFVCLEGINVKKNIKILYVR